MFERINYILTIENTLDLKLETYTLDFEIALQKTFLELFPKKRCIGSYYHFCRNLREKAKDYKLLNKYKKNTTNFLLKELYKLPFNYKNDTKLILDKLEKYEKLDNIYENFNNYFKKQWLKYFENQILNYSKLKKDERSNSYIENYNRIIKIKLSKYLYGKNHCRISWPLFIYFIKNEEEEYRLAYSNLEKEMILKNITIEKKMDLTCNTNKNNKENEFINDKEIIIKKKNERLRYIWFRWN